MGEVKISKENTYTQATCSTSSKPNQAQARHLQFALHLTFEAGRAATAILIKPLLAVWVGAPAAA